MKNHIELFLDSPSSLGDVDESIYDTNIKEEILSIIVRTPTIKEFKLERVCLNTQENTQKLYVSLLELLTKHNTSYSQVSLEEKFREYSIGAPKQSQYLLILDEFFGDYFYPHESSKKFFPQPYRNLFYADVCSYAFMLLPPVVIALVAIATYQGSINSTLYVIITIFVAFVSMLLGTTCYDWINEKIQTYEGVILEKKS